MSKEEEISRFRSAGLVLLGLIIVLPLLLTASAPTPQAEGPLKGPSPAAILNTLGYTNVALFSAQTFQAGAYEASLLAEYAGYCDTTESGYYPIDTSVFTHLCARAVAPAVADNEGRWNTEPTTITTTQNVSCLYCLHVKTSPVGIAVIPGAGVYQHGTNVSLHAPTYVPDEGGTNGQRYRFDHWDVDGTPIAGNPITVLMTANHTATAHYVLQYLITFTHTGLDTTANSPVVTVNSVLQGFGDLPLSFWADECSSVSYNYYTVVTSTTTGKRFTLDHVTGPLSPFTVTGPDTITGTYRTQYQLTITTTPGGTTDRPTGGWFTAQTEVPVLAIPDPDYVLDQWELDGTPLGSANPANVVMDSAHHLHAVFKHVPPPPTEYYLTVKTDPLDITSIPGEGWYVEGEDVILTAPGDVANSTGVRYSFSYWDVDGASQGASVPSITVSMEANHTATAHYTLQYYLAVASPYNTPTPSSGWFNAGDSVTDSVTSPWPGTTGTRYVCTGWTGTGSVPASGTTASASFTMDEPSSITWNWKIQYYLIVQTSPSGLVTIPGTGWYDASTSVPLTAPAAVGYWLYYWDVEGVPQGSGVPSISVDMDGPKTATAHYVPVTVGGSTASIEADLPAAWSSASALLAVAFGAAGLCVKKRRRTGNST